MILKKWLRQANYKLKIFAIVGVALLGVAAFGGLVPSGQVSAAGSQNSVNLYLFGGQGCPHCERAEQALKPYADKTDGVDYQAFEVYYNKDSQDKMLEVAKKLDINASGVPLIIVGDEPFVGYSDYVGEKIKERVDYCLAESCPDSVAGIVAASSSSSESQSVGSESKPRLSDEVIDLPIVGEVKVADFSLPALTVVIGLLDGFNPCAMWALLFIITLLIGMKDRKRMWLFGMTFIGVSAAVYFVFMAAWLNLFLFIGHIAWIRLVIGLFAVGIGAYYLYDWYRNQTGCPITAGKKRQAVFEKLRVIIKQKNIWLGLIGIIVLAAAVNLVELACSAGLPVLYTGILSAAELATWQYYAYMLLYVFFFMIDDLIVFTIAMVTLKVTSADAKFVRPIRLVGGIIMLVLGLLLIFAPHLLMLG